MDLGVFQLAAGQGRRTKPVPWNSVQELAKAMCTWTAKALKAVTKYLSCASSFAVEALLAAWGWMHQLRLAKVNRAPSGSFP